MKFNPLRFFKNIPTFFSEVKTELKKVSWLSKKETIQKTLTVIGVCLVAAIILGGLDFVFTLIIKEIIIK